MRASNKILAVSMLALLSISCSRDPLAPDCFEPDPNGSGCLIPNPGGSGVSGSCTDPASVPQGAVGIEYFYDLKTVAVGGTGTYTNWTTTTPLPPGLTLDPQTGVIGGIPEDAAGNMSFPLSIEVQDAITSETFTFDCAPIVINFRLSAIPVREEEMHCIPHTSTKEEMIAYLEGGDGSEITCSPINDGGLPCPLGDGNGRPPPGITFDADTCTHSGNITGNRRGTWVWMVQIEQNGYTTRVPFCASNDVDTFHDILVDANNQPVSDLIPGLLEYNPASSLSFGPDTYQWDIDDPACANTPANCNAYGFEFDVTCSPFDPPFTLTATSTGVGIHHNLGAMGPTPSASFEHRPWVASFEFSYCTSNAGANCDTMDPNFEQNAQTKYHFDVVGYPVP